MIECFVWGAGWRGKHIREIIGKFDENFNVVGYIDSNKEKCGNTLNGKIIFQPDILNERKDVYILICCQREKDIEALINAEYSYYSDKVIIPLYKRIDFDEFLYCEDILEIMDQVRCLEELYRLSYLER